MTRPQHALLSLACLSVSACSEFAIARNPKPPQEVADTDLTARPDTDSDPSTTDPCADVQITIDPWTTTAPFSAQADPIDASSRPFWDPAFSAVGFSAVTLPDVNSIPVGQDRIYRTTFRVTGDAPGVRLDLQSDDGVAVWIDGALVGRWGGAWQAEGCVNDAAQCTQFVLVDPIDVTSHATGGAHTLAMRVSNPVQNSYADLSLRCDAGGS